MNVLSLSHSWHGLLCLLWGQECQQLLSLQAYPAGQGVPELLRYQRVQWLPVINADVVKLENTPVTVQGLFPDTAKAFCVYYVPFSQSETQMALSHCETPSTYSKERDNHVCLRIFFSRFKELKEAKVAHLLDWQLLGS